ncbi:MAG TPA: DUF5818 domain-containing protein [Thermoanaerobaculia bacterium]|nr:DUF5818 domain-containing protein [Thermoanaerobaculia bacterium]
MPANRFSRRSLLPLPVVLVLVAAVLLLAPWGAADAAQKPPQPGDTVEITGCLTDEGAECPALRTKNNKLYTLTPRDLEGAQVGDLVTVTGTVANISFCQQGTTIEWETIEVVGSCEDPPGGPNDPEGAGSYSKK